MAGVILGQCDIFHSLQQWSVLNETFCYRKESEQIATFQHNSTFRGLYIGSYYVL